MTEDEREYLLRVLRDESEVRKRQARRMRGRIQALERSVRDNSAETSKLSDVVHALSRASKRQKALMLAAVFLAPHLDPVAVWRFVVALF